MIIRWFEKHNIVSWLITLIGAGFIYYFSSLSFEGGVGGPSFLPIVYHFFAFFFLSWFLQISLLRGKFSQRNFLIGLGIIFLYAILDEVHQIFVPGRFAGLFDVMVDSIGLICGGLVYYFRIRMQ